MNTIVYLIRHSIRFNEKNIDNYNTSQNKLLRNEKIILSVEGEKRAEILSCVEELQNLDVVYTSNSVRTLQTAKYILEKQKLKVNIDERFDERRVGLPNDDVVKNWFVVQYLDENFKTVGGESQLDVRNRFSEVIKEVLDNYKDKRICIFSHAYAITFYILKYCKLEHVSKEKFTIKFKDKIVMDRGINAPEVFKLTFDGDNLYDIELLDFDDLDYNFGV